jgi:hypothetical protein
MCLNFTLHLKYEGEFRSAEAIETFVTREFATPERATAGGRDGGVISLEGASLVGFGNSGKTP